MSDKNASTKKEVNAALYRETVTTKFEADLQSKSPNHSQSKLPKPRQSKSPKPRQSKSPNPHQSKSPNPRQSKKTNHQISNQTLIQHQNTEEHTRLKDIIQNIEKGSTPNKEEEEVIKRQMLFLLVSRNGQRSGTIINMKIKDLNESTEKDGEVVIRVSDHKTISAYGPAHLAIKQEYMPALRFLKAKRSEDSHLFTNKLGKQVESGFINDCLSEGLPDKNVMPSETEVKAFLYRKAAMVRFKTTLMMLSRQMPQTCQ